MDVSYAQKLSVIPTQHRLPRLRCESINNDCFKTSIFNSGAYYYLPHNDS